MKTFFFLKIYYHLSYCYYPIIEDIFLDSLEKKIDCTFIHNFHIFPLLLLANHKYVNNEIEKKTKEINKQINEKDFVEKLCECMQMSTGRLLDMVDR